MSLPEVHVTIERRAFLRACHEALYQGDPFIEEDRRLECSMVCEEMTAILQHRYPKRVVLVRTAVGQSRGTNRIEVLPPLSGKEKASFLVEATHIVAGVINAHVHKDGALDEGVKVAARSNAKRRYDTKRSLKAAG